MVIVPISASSVFHDNPIWLNIVLGYFGQPQCNQRENYE